MPARRADARGADEDQPAASIQDKADFESIDTESITFAFDTVYIVRKKSETVDLAPLRAYLDSIGDSLVIGEDDGLSKCMCTPISPAKHSRSPRSTAHWSWQRSKTCARSTTIWPPAAMCRVQTIWIRSKKELEGNGTVEDSQRHVAAPEKNMVSSPSVPATESPVFRDLGCDGIISGGQTMNPSTESILDAIDRTPAEVVFVLPNNKNIIMAAQQCQHLSDKQIVVIPSASVPQGMAAMLAVDTESGTEAIETAMNEAIARVITAQITYAARDSDIDGFAIKAGEYLALRKTTSLAAIPTLPSCWKNWPTPPKSRMPNLLLCSTAATLVKKMRKKLKQSLPPPVRMQKFPCCPAASLYIIISFPLNKKRGAFAPRFQRPKKKKNGGNFL